MMTNEKTTTFGLSSETLIELLHIGEDIESDTQSEDVARSEQLEWLLSGNLPVESSLLKSIPNMISHNEEIIGFLAGNTIGQMLANIQTDIYHIRKIKEYFKALSASEKKPCRRDAATAIYYAAIAYALVYHDVRITVSGHEAIDRSLSLLLAKAWLNGSIAELFKKACSVCQDFLDKSTHREKTP